MDTKRMKHYEKMGVNKRMELFSQTEILKKVAESFHASMEVALIRTQLIELIEENYDIGKVTEVYEIFGGYVNRSFGIYAEKDDGQKEYFVRKYKKGITDKEIMFEHNLINYAIDNGFDIAAGLIRTKTQSTYIKIEINGVTDYYAVYRYLPGEDKYSWDNPNCTDAEYASSAQVMARFHNAVRSFDPQGLERIEPKIMEFLPTRYDVFKGYAEKDVHSKYHTYYLKQVDMILDVIQHSDIPTDVWTKMPFTPCHNDFHPGNLKYSNETATGIFDFDWSKIDLRLFDVCLGIAYFCSSWDDETDGVLRLDKCEIFLKSYQKKLEEMDGLQPLTAEEKNYFPTMMAVANVYLLNWDICAYYEGSDLNEYEYIAYLSHNVRLMKWIESHKAELTDVIKNI